MTYAQRVGKYMRLRQELAAACRASRLDASHIARLSNEIVALERAMALPLQPVRAQRARSTA
jgi:hypothetical protein